jgi:hypothetical protein
MPSFPSVGAGGPSVSAGARAIANDGELSEVDDTGGAARRAKGEVHVASRAPEVAPRLSTWRGCTGAGLDVSLIGEGLTCIVPRWTCTQRCMDRAVRNQGCRRPGSWRRTSLVRHHTIEEDKYGDSVNSFCDQSYRIITIRTAVACGRRISP